MLPTIFQSGDQLRAAFESGLNQLLEHPTLGAYILVQANAAFDAHIQQQLSSPLVQSFETHAQRYRHALRHGQPLDDAPDDLLVFLKLMAMGIEHLQPTEFRQEGPWELQYNQLRSLRPSRNSSVSIDSLNRPYDPEGFNFNKPFLEKEMFWRGELLGRHVDLLYNKFPFLPLHGLLVPEAEQGHAQHLDAGLYRYVWELTLRLGETLPGIGFGYNAYGACASVNHLHFQMFLRETPLPVADARWQHNGGSEPYPAECMACTSVDEAWDYLQQAGDNAASYNLIFMPGKIFCLPRGFQGSYTHSDWTGGYAFYEMAGGLTTFNRDNFVQLTEQDLTGELARTRPT